MKKSNYSREEVLSIGLGAVAIILMMFLLYNQWTALQEGHAAIDRERASLYKTQASYRGLKQLESRAEQMQEKLNEFNKAFPGSPAEDLLINDISNMATAAGGDLLQVQFAEHITRKKYMEMPVTIDLKINYTGMIDMLDYMQNGPRALRIEEFTMRGGDQMSPGISANIKTTAFYTD
ncbi:Pilus assembly protein, PilO [Sporotomaculum syntrophicum]|uniref:Pilus assembly protein, PilO n=1 Tax=Sporotomaculum syntrophicum TaxID=182264 RepID=A0A9D3AYZ6_9FIRM|nr:type 4a pilus biogenesis protein PilO [Sporotomaculum syntrophicum]KAF1086577.1 Pilus assembly protein, PilO [Sporotomaculum syntrophicum]